MLALLLIGDLRVSGKIKETSRQEERWNGGYRKVWRRPRMMHINYNFKYKMGKIIVKT